MFLLRREGGQVGSEYARSFVNERGGQEVSESVRSFVKERGRTGGE